MAGLTEEQWEIVKEGLEEIRGLSDRMKGLEVAILGNGSKGLKQTVYELEGEVKELKSTPPKVPAPRYSWPQVLTILAIYITIAGGIGTFNFFSISDMKSVVKDNSVQVAKIQDALVQHITQGSKP